MTVSTPRVDALLDRLEGDAGRVAALGAADDVDADPLAPGGELLDGGGAEGVGRAQHDRAVLGDQDPGDLADGGGLAGAVDADDEDDAGLAVGAADLQAAVHGPGRPGSSSSSRSTARASAGVAALDPQPGAQPLDQLLGRRDADVGGEQGVLDRLPGVLVEPVAREQGEQAAAQGRPASRPAAGAAAPAGTRCPPASRAPALDGGAARPAAAAPRPPARAPPGRRDDVGAGARRRDAARACAERPRVSRPTSASDARGRRCR